MLARELKLSHSVFDLSDRAATRTAFSGVAAVANCAGPFSATSQAMIDACLETKTHYADITGEIAVFVDTARRRDAARNGRGAAPAPARSHPAAAHGGAGRGAGEADRRQGEYRANAGERFASDTTHVWSEARNSNGAVHTARLTTGNGYRPTVDGVLLAVETLLDWTAGGSYFTPSQLMGPRCVERLPGSSAIEIA